jgi:uncharacterized protein
MHKLLIRKRKITSLALGLICISVNINAQNANDSAKNVSPILVTNHTENNRQIILVKWLTDKLIYPNGVNIYRQEPGEITWSKLNPKPIVKGTYQPSALEYKVDSTLKQYVELAKTIKPIDLKDMTKVFVLVKSVQSEGFARYLGIQYNDTNIALNKTYRYKVTSITSKGEENIGHSEFIKAALFIPNLPPSAIEIKAFEKSVTIKWCPEDLRFHGVNIYRYSNRDTIMRRINKMPLMISKVEHPKGTFKYPEVFFTDAQLQNGVKYTYRIACIDFFGRESGLSEKVMVMPGDRTPPLIPSFPRIKIDKYDIRISWKNQTSPDQEGITIYRSYKYDDHYVKINPQLLPRTDTVYIDKNLDAGFYYYQIAAVDSAGNEGKSSKILAEVHDITPPAIPQNISATADTGRIILKWDANTEPDLMGYQIFRTVDKDLDAYYVLMNAEPIKKNSFIDTLPRNARNRFLYKVTAVDSAYNRSAYPPPVNARMPDVIPPVQPVIIGVSPKDDYLLIEWVPNRELDLAGYELFRATNTSKNKTKVNSGLLSPSVTRFTDRTVSADTLYDYTLTATDSTGNHSISSAVFSAILPHKISKEDESAIIKFIVIQPLFSKSIKLQWSARTTNTFIGYAVYKRTSHEEEPVKLMNLATVQNYVDRAKKARSAQYQLRLYHQTGQVVKSDWISKQKQ